MYNLINQKHDIISLKLSEKDVITKNKKKELYVNDKLISENIDDFFISKNNEYIFYNYIHGCCSFKKDFTFSTKSSRFILDASTKSENFIFQIDIESNTCLYLNNTKLDEEFKLISNYNWEFLLLNNNALYLYDNITIKSCSVRTGVYEWEINLKEHGDIRKIICVIEDCLWLTLYRSGKDKNKEILIGINIHSGEIIQMLSEELPISDVHIQLIEDKENIVSIKSGISTNFTDSFFVEIDALTGNILRNQTINDLEKENLKIGLWNFDQDKIYFTASKDFLNSTHIGILDYSTLDLLWFEEVKDRKAGLKEIQVSADKIYVLDQGNQLHVYEQEE